MIRLGTFSEPEADLKCLCLCVYTAIMIDILYLFFGAFPLVFPHTYGFNLW